MKFLKKPYLILLPVILIMALSAFMLSGTVHQKIYQKAGCPVIDFSDYTIVNPTCGKSDGSISGLKVTSTGTKIQYTWHDVNNNNAVVGNSLNLTKIPAGTYILEVTDNSGCTNSVFSPKIVVVNANTIAYDDSRISIKTASCKNDGAITGIITGNATSYVWYDVTTSTTISTSATTPDISNLAPGQYQLTVSNSTCDVVKTYYVASAIEVPTVVSHTTTDALCGGGGSISVTLKVASDQPRLTIALENVYGMHIYDGIILSDNPNPTYSAGGDPGDYFLYVTDNNGCSVLLGKYTIGGGDLEISKTESTVTNDRCNQHLASIVPVLIGAGPAGKNEAQYTWYDNLTNQVISYTRVLSGIGAGEYKLVVVQGGGCRATAIFDVINISPSLVPPIAKGSTICLPGMINITITNTDTSKLFRLYDSPTATTAIDSSTNGIFYRNVTETTNFYVTRVGKDCESDRTEVTETVVASIKIPNAFTPNGDGINDTWNIAGIDKFPGADVKVFTRSGQLIYHSVNYPVPFNGTYNGSLLPPGVYYYILDVKQPVCFGKISGSLTIIR